MFPAGFDLHYKSKNLWNSSIYQINGLFLYLEHLPVFPVLVPAESNVKIFFNILGKLSRQQKGVERRGRERERTLETGACHPGIAQRNSVNFSLVCEAVVSRSMSRTISIT